MDFTIRTEEVVKNAFANESYSDQSEHRLVANLRIPMRLFQIYH